MPESTGYAVKNNAESTVADNPLTSSATTLNVATGQGSRFPSTFPFLITIWDDVTHPDPTDDPNMEITECSARSTDALTIVRGKEETSGVEHANGARVAMLITAGIFNDPTYGVLTKLNGIEDNATADQTKADIDALGIDHGVLDGLTDDDHTQYLLVNATRAMTGILNMGTHKIQNVVDPTLAQDAATKAWCDANFSGGGVTDHGALTGLADDDHTQYLLASGARAMSGDLDINDNAILHCNRITAGNNEQLNMYGGDPYGSAVAVQPYNAAMYPGQILFVVPNAAHDAHRVPMLIDGNTDTPIVDIYYGLDMGSKKITSVANPASAQDAATKNYCETNFNNYTHPSAPPCQGATSFVAGHATAAQISKLEGIESGATVDQTKADIDALGINATQVDGCDAGYASGNVLKIQTWFVDAGSILSGTGSSINTVGHSGTNGYQLTQDASGLARWDTAADLIFSDTHCPKCGKKFEDGEVLVLYIVGHNEVGDILTIPMHKECAEAQKKTVTIKRKIMEDRFVFDELTGKPRVQRVRKMQKKTVTKKRMKKDVELDRKTGEFWQLEDGKRKKKITVADATEEYKEEIDEQIYKNVDFEI